MRFERISVLLCCLLLPLTLAAKEKPRAILESLPSSIAKCERGEIDGFDEPGLGQSIAYREKQLLITVYVYDLDHPRIASGIEDPIVQKAFVMAKSDIMGAKGKIYSKVETISDGTIRHGESGTTLSARYRIDRMEEAKSLPIQTFSEVHVLGARDHLVKLRITGALDSEARLKPIVDEFIPALLRHLAKP
jgi:hypothetical protein